MRIFVDIMRIFVDYPIINSIRNETFRQLVEKHASKSSINIQKLEVLTHNNCDEKCENNVKQMKTKKLVPRINKKPLKLIKNPIESKTPLEMKPW